MIPINIRIDHYRALRGIDVPLGDYTAMVGPNGVGKSTALDALDFFLSPAHRVDEDDLQYGMEDPISVTVTLTALNDEERTLYADSLNDAGELVVTKLASPVEAARYEVLGSRHRSFDELRELARTAKKSDLTNAYKVFASEHPEYDLKVQRSADDNLAELRRWEQEHPEQCEIGPVPFAFSGSNKDQLIASTRVVYVPAVHDASESFEGARSPLQQMLAALVYPRFEMDEEFVRLQEHVQSEYDRLFPREGTPELVRLANRITGALETFCPGASIKLGWNAYEAALGPPPVQPAIIEDGVPTDVEHKGHGLQRALIIAMLQAEDEYRRTTNEDLGNVHVVLMIEEPELYQHPTQCRHFRKLLSNLASEHRGIRVLVTTHSPDFISLEGIDSIRILRREPAAKGVPARKLSSVSLAQIAERYSEVLERPVDMPQLLRQLHVVDNVMREAFFAYAVVLVEGDGDRGLIAAQCAIDGLDLEGKGIVIIACGGKSTLPLPTCILRMLGINHYVIFDSDRDPVQNKPLLKALGVPDKAMPKTGTPATAVSKTYAVLSPKIEDVVKGSVGASAFDSATVAVADEYGRTPEQTLKNPVTAERVLARLREAERECKTLHEVVSRIAAL